MNCTCEECNGRGHIECPECNGSGGIKGHIETIHLSKSQDFYEELSELQKDCVRVKAQAKELTELKPQFAQKYEAQMRAVLDEIDSQAEKILKSKKHE